MPKGNWLQYAPIGFGLALCALLLFEALGGGEYLAGANQRQGANASAYEARNDPDQWLAPCQDSGANADGKPQSPCDANYYERRDLEAQRGMGVAAWAQFGLGVVNLLLLVGTLLLTINATRAATEAARLARDELDNLERPHLQVRVIKFIEPGEDSDEFKGAMIGSPNNRYAVAFRFYNYGRAPAIITHIHRTLEHGSTFEPADPDVLHGRLLPHGTIAMPGEESGTFFRSYRLRKGEYVPLLTTWWIHGFIRFEDVRGNKYVVGFSLAQGWPNWERVGPNEEDPTKYNYGRRLPAPAPRLRLRQRLAAAWSALTN